MPENDHWKKKALNIIHDSYKSSKYYEEVIPSINNLIMYESENFSDYSINIINFFSDFRQLDYVKIVTYSVGDKN